MHLRLKQNASVKNCEIDLKTKPRLSYEILAPRSLHLVASSGPTKVHIYWGIPGISAKSP